MKNVSLSSPATQVWRDSSVQWTIQVNIVEEFAQQWQMSDFGSPAIQVWSNLSGQWRNINKNLSEHCWGTWSTMKVIDFSSPATGVEELKWIKKKIKNPIMLKDLIPLLRYLINNKTVWLGIHSSEQRKYKKNLQLKQVLKKLYDSTVKFLCFKNPMCSNIAEYVGPAPRILRKKDLQSLR